MTLLLHNSFKPLSYHREKEFCFSCNAYNCHCLRLLQPESFNLVVMLTIATASVSYSLHVVKRANTYLYHRAERHSYLFHVQRVVALLPAAELPGVVEAGERNSNIKMVRGLGRSKFGTVHRVLLGQPLLPFVLFRSSFSFASGNCTCEYARDSSMYIFFELI